MDSPIEALFATGTHLIIASSRKLVSFDLVAGCETGLAAQVSAPGIGNLVAVDPHRQLIAVAINQFSTEPEFALRGKILLLRPDSLAPVFSTEHSSAIASITYTPSGFMFVDTDSRVGVIAPEIRQDLTGSAEDDLASQMSKMLVNAQATANVLFARSGEDSMRAESADATDKWTSHKAIDVAVLQPIFANIEGVSLDSLFERVVRAVQ
ncbi:hypothetical protein OXX80_012739 [Metschnikowia pulcherrima]